MAKDCKCRQCHCLIINMFCFWTNIGCSSPSRLLPSYINVRFCLSSRCDESLVAFLIGMTLDFFLCQIFKSYVSSYTLCSTRNLNYPATWDSFGSYMHGKSWFVFPCFFFWLRKLLKPHQKTKWSRLCDLSNNLNSFKFVARTGKLCQITITLYLMCQKSKPWNPFYKSLFTLLISLKCNWNSYILELPILDLYFLTKK